jgi:hypothetical protein
VAIFEVTTDIITRNEPLRKLGALAHPLHHPG